jgi:hypothetical protein
VLLTQEVPLAVPLALPPPPTPGVREECMEGLALALALREAVREMEGLEDTEAEVVPLGVGEELREWLALGECVGSVDEEREALAQALAEPLLLPLLLPLPLGHSLLVPSLPVREGVRAAEGVVEEEGQCEAVGLALALLLALLGAVLVRVTAGVREVLGQAVAEGEEEADTVTLGEGVGVRD